MTAPSAPTDRTTLRRKPERGEHDASSVYSILDEAFVCHLAITDEAGRPVVLPTTFVRVDDTLYVHGSPASRLLRRTKSGIDICVTVTIVDALVLARSAFHHSVNYRSVAVFATAHEVTDLAEKRLALHALVEHLVPGRTADCRPPTDQELKSTTVLALDLREASAKARTGPPIDDEEDLLLDHWAGVVPLHQARGTAVPDGDYTVPPYLVAFTNAARA